MRSFQVAAYFEVSHEYVLANENEAYKLINHNTAYKLTMSKGNVYRAIFFIINLIFVFKSPFIILLPFSIVFHLYFVSCSYLYSHKI